MWRTGVIAGLMLLIGCASTGGGTKTEVNAVVQDERARQAASLVAARGEGSTAALKAGAAAANPETVKPPT